MKNNNVNNVWYKRTRIKCVWIHSFYQMTPNKLIAVIKILIVNIVHKSTV
jgi:hypothetical protein